MIDRNRLITQAAALGVHVTPRQAELLDKYCAAVIETNREMNLTAITAPRDVEVKHLLDCLSICPLPQLRGKVADVGTGAGFPGAVLAIMRPDLALTLIDATAKKLAFVRQTCDAFGLAVEAVHGRAEELARGAYREQFDAVTARAVAPMAGLLEYCLPLVRVGGHFIAMKGPEAPVELGDSAYALRQLGGRPVQQKEVALPGGITRVIVIIEKTAATPARYPRGGKRISGNPLL